MGLFRTKNNEMLVNTGKATGMNDQTPSYSEYFSWINNTNEGSTEGQTLANLDFFRWLREEFGMQLDIYAFDAGNLDGPRNYYGYLESAKFKTQFPHGFQPIAEKSRSIGCKLGIWGGPDGFGHTLEDEQKRIDLMVSLCRDFNFSLFKFDGVCGTLRKQKQDAFVKMMISCRKYAPELILLNHRLDLGKGFPYATTYLLGGQETYIDVFMSNKNCAPHHRGGALSREPPPNLERLTEDHGVCISSCIAFWEDDLILQAFNRCLILAPQVYGSPWFLPDHDYPKFSRIFNLHRKYRDILVTGIKLPEQQYGLHAVSRGNESLRFITLRNLSWNFISIPVDLNESIGLKVPSDNRKKIFIWRVHPHECFLGLFEWGQNTKIEIPAYRSCLIIIGIEPLNEIYIQGCDYEIIRETVNKPVKIKLLGMPGSKSQIHLNSSLRSFQSANIDGKDVSELLNQKGIDIEFEGNPFKDLWHRKLGNLHISAIPNDAEALYEATCFAADNNALEIRELTKISKSSIKEVQTARDFFINQPILKQRGIWDRFAFDGDPTTFFKAWDHVKVKGGALRIDFGQVLSLDRVVIHGNGLYLDTKNHYIDTINIEGSVDLSNWIEVPFTLTDAVYIEVNQQKLQYLRITGIADEITEIEGIFQGKSVDRSLWRASNLFAHYKKIPTCQTWSTTIQLNEIPKNSYLAVPLFGIHWEEGAYVSFRVEGKPIGAPDRSPSYPSNVWEYWASRTMKNYTYYLPLSPDFKGKSIDVIVLCNKKTFFSKMKPEVWITAYPTPFDEKILTLIDKKIN